MDAAEQPSHWAGWYYDGWTARREPVTVMIGPAGVGFVSEDGRVRFWPYEDLRQTQGAFAHEPVRLERGDATPEALVVDDNTLLAAIRGAAPHFRSRFRQPGRLAARARLATAVTLGILASAGALYLWGVPALAARLAHTVPVSWEQRLGQQVAAELAAGATQCSDPVLEQTVERMAHVLAPHAGRPAAAFRFLVIDDSLINALALPGGTIVFFSGLIERTATPDELAGVLAHEMQHVILRHSTQALLQDLPVRVLIAALTGDAPALGSALHAAITLRSLHFSRQAEREADREAVAMLRTAGVDARGLVSFLARLEEAEASVPAYFSTHPPTRERIGELSRLAAGTGSPPITWPFARDWQAIRSACM